MQKAIKIHQDDNVAVALTPIAAGETVTAGEASVVLKEDIPQGHKFALQPIAEGDSIIKYGCPIGKATAAIETGTWVHVQNIHTGLGDLLTYTYDKNVTPLPSREDRTFRGFRRDDGKVGVRNEIWIIPTVGCVNNIVDNIEKKSQKLLRGSVSAIKAFRHPYGCSQMSDDQENTRKALADLIRHPNAGGVLVVGLGCENSNIEVLKGYLGDFNPEHIKFLNTQDFEDEIEEGIHLVDELVSYASAQEREDISCSELIIGLKCGGSDGLSGITANAVVGSFSDRLISRGGTTILTEVPEMFGAETLLMNRCESEEIFDKCVNLINDFKMYYQKHNLTIYENPSPGNKKGGISTLEDKSNGCVQKSGSAPVVDVLAYADPVQKKGLNLLSAPGNDLVASTALAASGAQIVLFTTGRGTPFSSPVPTVKISSNSALAERKKNWIDFNAGEMVDGTPKDELADRLFDYVIRVASGEQIKSEEDGYYDLAIFKNGVTL